MEKPSKRVIALLVFLGFLLALLEPLILLLMGDDLGGAFWPMAKLLLGVPRVSGPDLVE